MDGADVTAIAEVRPSTLCVRAAFSEPRSPTRDDLSSFRWQKRATLSSGTGPDCMGNTKPFPFASWKRKQQSEVK